MWVTEFHFFEKTFTLWLKSLLGLVRNEANPYLGSELFEKKCAYNLKMAELCDSVEISQRVHFFFL